MRYQSTEDRFWAKVEAMPTGCWEWRASRDRDGYGRFRFPGCLRRSHRLAYEWLVGEIPEGLQLDHLCRNTACVNPTHLEPVTSKENTRRGLRPRLPNRAVTHCPQGHEYSPENTYRCPPKGWRSCRECSREAGRRHRARLAALKRA
jgi:hypothetical protein